MPPKSKQPITKPESNIDLQCTLCPKNPKFSDASHLLTHISSKGHLSHRFKLQIRAQNEQAARDILANFDMWYKASNMDSLLAERLALKDNKTKRKPRASSSSNAAKIKPEVVASNSDDLAGISDFRAPVPRMHLWSISADNAFTSPTNEFAQAMVYSTPTTRRHVPNFSHSRSLNKIDPQLTTPGKPGVEENGEKKDLDGNKLTDSAKLKGVIWPGMDLFDSATPEQKRMRNQKKDGSILRGMISASRGVEPMEISYHANGDLRSSRDIFGPLSDLEETPTKIRSASPRKRKARKPAAVANPTTNAPRFRAPRGKKAVPCEDPQKKEALTMQAPPPIFMQPAPILNPLVGSGLRLLPDEYTEEFELTINTMRPKKRGFAIFQDLDIPEVSPGRTESPLEDQNYDDGSNSIFGADPFTTSTHRFHNNGFPSYTNHPTSSSIMQASPTPAPKPGPFRPSGKENLLQQADMQQQLHGRRTLSASHVYPAQVFHDPTRNPLYQRHHHGYAHSFSYTPNPYVESSRSPNVYRPNFGPNFPASYRPVAQMTAPPQIGQSQSIDQHQGQSMNSQPNTYFSGNGYM